MAAFIWSIVQVSQRLLLLALLGLALAWIRWRKGGLAIATFSIVGFVLWGVSPAGVWLIRPLETRFEAPAELPEDIAGFIVLGGSVDAILSAYWGQPSLNNRAERLTAGAALARRRPDLPLAFTGGPSIESGAPLSEAHVARDFFESMAVPNPLILESTARNTHDNAQFLADILPDAAGMPWVLVTSAYHMPRSVGVFRAAGIAVIPYPVDYKTTEHWSGWSYEVVDGASLADFALREWLALFAYHQRGWTAEFLPGP